MSSVVLSSTIDTLLRQHKIIALDTMIFIYQFEENAQYKAVTRKIFDLLEKGIFKGVTSVVTLLEVLVRPLSLNLTEIASVYEMVLKTYPNLLLADIGHDDAGLAAKLRAKHGLSSPDAIQVAVSINSGATAFVTNDSVLKKIDEIKVILIDDMIA